VTVSARPIICRHQNLDVAHTANTAVNVQNVVYNDVTISNSDAGIEIKAYPDNVGIVKNITYNTFTMVRPSFPALLWVLMIGNPVRCRVSDRCVQFVPD
jgi:polygalacturonase